jgi:VWFA-related protein
MMTVRVRFVAFLASALAVTAPVAAPVGQRAQFTSATEMVALAVSDTDQHGRPVQGLHREDFIVYDDDAAQDIRVFSANAVPVSWGLVLDRSGSMAGMIDDVYKASLHALDLASKTDEAFVSTFSDTVSLEHEFTRDHHVLQNAVIGIRALGGTALWDAVADGIRRMAEASEQKRVLVVVTDGDDNESRRRFSDLLGDIERSDVIIYTVGLTESRGILPQRMETSLKRTLMHLAQATGGAAHFPDSMKKCQEAMSAIAQDVHGQYLLGYDPPGPRNGEWHRVRVELRPAATQSVRTARTREGYYRGPSRGNAGR